MVAVQDVVLPDKGFWFYWWPDEFYYAIDFLNSFYRKLGSNINCLCVCDLERGDLFSVYRLILNIDNFVCGILPTTRKQEVNGCQDNVLHLAGIISGSRLTAQWRGGLLIVFGGLWVLERQLQTALF